MKVLSGWKSRADRLKKGHVSVSGHVLERSHEETCVFRFWEEWKRGGAGDQLLRGHEKGGCLGPAPEACFKCPSKKGHRRLGSDLNPGRKEGRVLVVDRWAPSLPLGCPGTSSRCSFPSRPESVPCLDTAASGHPQAQQVAFCF